MRETIFGGLVAFLLILCIFCVGTRECGRQEEQTTIEAFEETFASDIEETIAKQTEEPIEETIEETGEIYSDVESTHQYPQKLSEDNMVAYDDIPSFKEKAKDTWGNVYENVYCFNSRSYDFGNTSATFAVDGNSNELTCVIAPHKSLKDSMTLLIYVDDTLVNESAIEPTTQPFELSFDVRDSNTVTFSLKHKNGTNVAVSGPSGGIIVDGIFEQSK